MRCTETALRRLVAAHLFLFTCFTSFTGVTVAAAQVAPPTVQETSLESGLRVVVATRSGAATASLIEALLVVPVGAADDASPGGSGLAALAAEFVVAEQERWSCEVRPESTLFRAALEYDGIEAALADLAKRLTADNVEEERFQQFVDKRVAAVLGTLDRLREAAYPTTSYGAPAAGWKGVHTPGLDDVKRFLADRYGAEGSVLVLVLTTTGPPAELELRVERALGGFARARGVAPRFEFEPLARMARRVTAPKSTEHDAGALGFRLPWREDVSGDATAFTLAWLETAAHGALSLVVTTRQGTLAGFAWANADEAQRLHGLDGALTRLMAQELTASEAAAVIDRCAKQVEESTREARGLATLLAREAFDAGDPLAAFSRIERLRDRTASDWTLELRARLPGANRLEVVPATSGEPRRP